MPKLKDATNRQFDIQVKNTAGELLDFGYFTKLREASIFYRQCLKKYSHIKHINFNSQTK